MSTKGSAGEKNYIFTDLAVESGRIAPEEYKSARYERRKEAGATVEVLTVKDDAGRLETGKEPGRYVTVSAKSLKDGGDVAPLGTLVGKELRRLASYATGKEPAGDTKVLVAGLGNRFITPDALGSRCADKIKATRHVKGSFSVFDELGCSDVCVMSPGVLAQTGIESSELIKGAAKSVAPDLIIVIDAMAARSTSRLATTIQLCNVGLAPGKGVGNRRPEIDRKSMGCPVISIGSPTVVGSSTLIWDALCGAGIDDVSPELKRTLDDGKDFFVTLNDSDAVIERLSDVISQGVNFAFGTSDLP